jgi:CheY-like chemotaxis protein
MTQTPRDYSSFGFLVVDDKKFLRDLVQGMLHKCSVREVRHAESGEAAKAILASGDCFVDFVLCDWNMGPGSGLELLRSIRSGELHSTPRDLRFIMLTAFGEEAVVSTAVELHVNGYIVKPVSFDKLTRAIDIALVKPVALKSSETYAAIDTTLPSLVTKIIPERRVPPWVLLSSMRPHKKAAVSQELFTIHEENKEADRDRPIINREQLDLDSVTPGRVLAENIYMENGRLFLTRGTILNERLLARLHKLSRISEIAINLVVGDYGD